MALNAVVSATTPATTPSQSLSPNPNPIVAVTANGSGDHEKTGTGAYSYSQPGDIPGLAKSIRETLVTVQAAPHVDKSERHELARLRAAIMPVGESGVSASATTSLVAEAVLSIMGIKRREAIDKGSVIAESARLFMMNWFASSAAGHCDCQHGPGKTRR